MEGGEGPKLNLPKNDFRSNIRSSPKTCFVKEVLEKHFISLINLSKFLAILYHNKPMKKVIFNKAAFLPLQLYLQN